MAPTKISLFETDEYYTKECNCWKTLVAGDGVSVLRNTKHHQSCIKFDKNRELCWLDYQLSLLKSVPACLTIGRDEKRYKGLMNNDIIPGFITTTRPSKEILPGVVEVYCNDRLPPGKVDLKNDKGEVVGTIENLEFKCDGVVPEFPSDFLNTDTLKPVLPIDHVDVGVFCDPPVGSHEQGEKIT